MSHLIEPSRLRTLLRSRFGADQVDLGLKVIDPCGDPKQFPRPRFNRPEEGPGRSYETKEEENAGK